MKIPLQIVLRDLPHSDALEERVRNNVKKLEAFYPGIVSCRVTVSELSKHRHQGRHFQVRLDVHLPDKEIVANRDHDEDVYVALRDACNAAQRQIEDAVRIKRGDVKKHVFRQPAMNANGGEP